MQNKKVEHPPSTKYSYFHKITGPTLFFSGEKIEKKKFLLPTDHFFFSILVKTQLFFTPKDETSQNDSARQRVKLVFI